MAKSYRLETVDYDPKKEKFFRVPPRCLYMVVVNNGSSNLIVDNMTELKPGQSLPFPYIPDFHISQDLRIQIINDANKTLTTKVRVRMAIEN